MTPIKVLFTLLCLTSISFPQVAMDFDTIHRKSDSTLIAFKHIDSLLAFLNKDSTAFAGNLYNIKNLTGLTLAMLLDEDFTTYISIKSGAGSILFQINAFIEYQLNKQSNVQAIEFCSSKLGYFLLEKDKQFIGAFTGTTAYSGHCSRMNGVYPEAFSMRTIIINNVFIISKSNSKDIETKFVESMDKRKLGISYPLPRIEPAKSLN
jgi:hypothetical protein